MHKKNKKFLPFNFYECLIVDVVKSKPQNKRLINHNFYIKTGNSLLENWNYLS